MIGRTGAFTILAILGIALGSHAFIKVLADDTGSIDVANCSVNVPSGGSARGSLVVSCLSGNVTVQNVTFNGSASTWVQVGSLPITLSAFSNTIPFIVTVPSGTSEGQYNASTTCTIAYTSSIQAVRAQILINVTPAQSSIANAIGDGWNQIAAWTLAHLGWILVSASTMAALIVIALVAGRKKS
jgi:hypothetical protein